MSELHECIATLEQENARLKAELAGADRLMGAMLLQRDKALLDLQAADRESDKLRRCGRERGSNVQE